MLTTIHTYPPTIGTNADKTAPTTKQIPAIFFGPYFSESTPDAKVIKMCPQKYDPITRLCSYADQSYRFPYCGCGF